MTLVSPSVRRLFRALQCLGKRRYGYLDRSRCFIPPGKEPLYLVLSPDLYHIAVETLPVATAQEALRYAPAYFDLPEAHYGAFALEGERYLLSACDSEPVRLRLEEAGVNPASVERFVLAQEVFKHDFFPISLEDGSALALNEGIVVRVPSRYLGTPPRSTIEEALRDPLPCVQGFKADMRQGGEASLSTLRMSAILAAVVVLNLGVQGALSHREANRITEEHEQMKAAQNLPATQMELEAQASTWEKKEKEQIKLRRIVAAFGTLPLEVNATEPAKAPVLPSAPSEGIVLVPGSDPSQRNLLLVAGDQNVSQSVVAGGGEYVTSLVYENGAVTFKLTAPTQSRAEELRTAAAKTLKTGTVTVRETTVEGSAQ